MPHALYCERSLGGICTCGYSYKESKREQSAKTPMQELKTYTDAQTFLVNCVEELLEGYEFKMTNILDANRRCTAQKNRVALHQLERAYHGFVSIEQWHDKHSIDQRARLKDDS